MDTVGGDGQIPRDEYGQTCPAGLKIYLMEQANRVPKPLTF